MTRGQRFPAAQGPELPCRPGARGTRPPGARACRPPGARGTRPPGGSVPYGTTGLGTPPRFSPKCKSLIEALMGRICCPAQRPEKKTGGPRHPGNPPDSAFPGRCQPPEFQRRFREKRTWMRSEFNSEPFHPETSSGIPSSSPGIATGSRGSQGGIREMTNRCLLFKAGGSAGESPRFLTGVLEPP